MLVCQASSMWETHRGGWRETNNWSTSGAECGQDWQPLPENCQGPGTVPGLSPSLPQPNPAGYAFVSDSHLPDGETEAWKGGVAPWDKSTLPLSGKDHTSRGTARCRDWVWWWRGCPVSRQDPQSSEQQGTEQGNDCKGVLEEAAFDYVTSWFRFSISIAVFIITLQ